MTKPGRKFLFSKTFIALVYALLLAVIWGAVHERVEYEREQALERTRHANANLALGLEAHVRDVFNSLDNVMVFVRHELGAHPEGVDLARLVLQTRIDHTRLSSLVVVDAKGLLKSGVGTYGDYYKGDREYFVRLSKAANDELFVARPRQNVHGSWVLDLARPLRKRDGSFNGVIVASTELRNIAVFYDKTGRTGIDSASVVRTDGAGLINVSQNANLNSGDRERKHLMEAYRENPVRGEFRTSGSRSGDPKLMSFRKMANLPVLVVVGASERASLAPVVRSAGISYIVAAICSAVLALLAILLSRTIERRRQAMRQILRDEARFRAIFDQAFVGMAQSTPDGGKVIQVNKRFCDILGRTEQEVLAAPLAEFVHPDDRAAVAGLKQRRLVRRDGTIIWADTVTTRVRNEGGKADCLVTVMQDISEFKRIDQMKSEFVSIVSHELRTPLTSIRGSLGLVSGGVAGALPSQAQGLIDIAKNNCERLIRLINDILDIEKIESGKMRFELRETSLLPLAQRVVAANDAFARQYGVRFKVEACERPLLLNVDPDRLEQVLTNLLSNAAKFAPRDSEITVRLGLAGERVRVEIIDRGPGIPAEFRSRIFQKFSQADSSNSRQKGGTGLGLSICKAIVERMGGMIGFDTATGKGTTFFFELPRVAEASDPREAAQDTSRPRVLVCEDDGDIARVIAMMLANAGYATDVAHGLGQARSALAARTYDAMTLDIRLPDGDGIDFIAQLRTSETTVNLPVVVVSAYIDEDRMRVTNGSHAISEWLDKPIDESRLIRAIARGIEGRPRVLHVEPDRDLQCVVAAVAQDYAAFDFAGSVREAREVLTKKRFDVVVLELELPDGSGRQLLADLSSLESPPSVVLFSRRRPSPAERLHADAFLEKGPAMTGSLMKTTIQAAVLKRRHRHAA